MIEIWKIKQEAFVNRGNIILKSYSQGQNGIGNRGNSLTYL